jgi:tripartite-type tricarboxylate transporter receptor subunit TctC
MPGLRCLSLVLTLILSTVLTGPGFAQQYPSQPIKFVVPFPPGGAVDVLARIVGQIVSTSVGQTVVVENRPGGFTLIAANAVGAAEPDGHTLLFTSGQALNELLWATTGSKSKEFLPIVSVGVIPMLVAVNPSIPSSVNELISYAKRNPGKISYATFGKGSLPHLACEMFAVALDIKMTDVPYRGGAQSLQDAISGQIQLVCDTLLAVPFIRDGRLKAVALMSKERSAIAPEIPTFAELGYPEVVSNISIELYAPIGTPQEIIRKLNIEVNKALKDPAFKSGIVTLGGEPVGGDPEKLLSMLVENRARYGAIMRTLNPSDIK